MDVGGLVSGQGEAVGPDKHSLLPIIWTKYQDISITLQHTVLLDKQG